MMKRLPTSETLLDRQYMLLSGLVQWPVDASIRLTFLVNFVQGLAANWEVLSTHSRFQLCSKGSKECNQSRFDPIGRDLKHSSYSGQNGMRSITSGQLRDMSH
jgi:hypothetical protein